MRTVKNELGISTFLTGQEYSVYQKISEETVSTELNPRDQEIAKRLVSRGVATRRVRENKTYYRKL